MKKICLLTVILTVLLVVFGLSNIAFAGYDDNTQINVLSTNEKSEFNKIVKYENLESLNKETLDSETILLIPFDKIESLNLDAIKDLIANKDISILLGYTTFQDLLDKISNYNINIDVQAINEMLVEEEDFISKYDNNGWIDLRLEDDNQIYFGGFFTKAQDNDVILKNYNMYKGYINYGYVKETEKITEQRATRASKGNYELRFYWSSNTTYNKVYASASSSSSILVNLYRSEMLQNLQTESSRTYTDSNGGLYYENFVKVQANNSSGSLTTGYYMRHKTYDPRNGDEGWGGDDLWYTYCYTLDRLLQSAYNSDYQSSRSAGHVFYRDGYYGVRIKSATNRYNSSGGNIGSAPVNSVVWVSGSTKCGYSNPQYMSIHGYSSSSSSSITKYSSTTFVNAGLLTSNPKNYTIDVRWW